MIRKEILTQAEHVQNGRGIVKTYHICTKEELGKVGRLYGRVVLDPGVPLVGINTLAKQEPYYVLKGQGTFIDNDEKAYPVGPGDVCLIENGQFHSIENNSDEPLEFMA